MGARRNKWAAFTAAIVLRQEAFVDYIHARVPECLPASAVGMLDPDTELADA